MSRRMTAANELAFRSFSRTLRQSRYGKAAFHASQSAHASKEGCVHTRRVADRHRHHCDSRCVVATRPDSSEAIRPRDELLQQSSANRNRLLQLRERSKAVSVRSGLALSKY